MAKETLKTLLVLFLGVFPFLLLAFYHFPEGDTYAFAVRTQAMGVMQNAINWYLTWVPRYVSNLFISLPLLSWGHLQLTTIIVTPLLLFTTYGSFWWSFSAINRAGTSPLASNKIALISTVFFVVVLNELPYLIKGFFSFPSAVTYQTANVLLVVWLACLYMLLQSKPIKSTRNIIFWVPFGFGLLAIPIIIVAAQRGYLTQMLLLVGYHPVWFLLGLVLMVVSFRWVATKLYPNTYPFQLRLWLTIATMFLLFGCNETFVILGLGVLCIVVLYHLVFYRKVPLYSTVLLLYAIGFSLFVFLSPGLHNRMSVSKKGAFDLSGLLGFVSENIFTLVTSALIPLAILALPYVNIHLRPAQTPVKSKQKMAFWLSSGFLALLGVVGLYAYSGLFVTRLIYQISYFGFLFIGFSVLVVGYFWPKHINYPPAVRWATLLWFVATFFYGSNIKTAYLDLISGRHTRYKGLMIARHQKLLNATDDTVYVAPVLEKPLTFVHIKPDSLFDNALQLNTDPENIIKWKNTGYGQYYNKVVIAKPDTIQ